MIYQANLPNKNYYTEDIILYQRKQIHVHCLGHLILSAIYLQIYTFSNILIEEKNTRINLIYLFLSCHCKKHGQAHQYNSSTFYIH